MKRRSERGVVDSRLNVYGVEGLKIAGAFPHLPCHYDLRRARTACSLHHIPDRSIHLSWERCRGKHMRPHALPRTVD